MINILSDLILCVLMLILFILFIISLFSGKYIAVLIELLLSINLSMNQDVVSGFIKACLEFIISGEFIFDMSAKAFVLSFFQSGVTLACILFGGYILYCIAGNK